MKIPSAALLVLALALLVVPLALVGAGAVHGTDDQAKAAVTQIQPGYQPWFQPLWKPASVDVENALFTLQAAAGAAVVGYVLGFRRGRRRSGGS
ncbi:MAG: energy-coupling factor ABC transporter substrate-binding protein [Candidatus Limnocylindrales bacterium]